ncbi:unnamed protein product [Rotaria sp. Silwood2]|nr:unnamed protein product [Rotaria sp. Silwood2]
MMPTSTWDPTTMTDAIIFQQLLDQEAKELQEKLTNLMVESIAEAENKILECRELLHKEIYRLSIYDKDIQEGFSEKLMDLIYRRVNIMNQKFDCISNFKINYYLRHHYDDDDDDDLQQDTLSIPSVSFSPTMIMGTPLHLLTEEQLKLLNRGPTYVPLCHAYVSSSSCVSMKEIIQKQYKVLQHHLSSLFQKCQMNPARLMFINNEIKNLYTNIFSISLPNSLRQRALYEKHLVQSIREHFKTHDLLLRRTADRRNVFYLAHRPEFEEKTNEYMKTTDTFELCKNINEENLQETRDYLTKMIKSLNEAFQEMFHGKTNKNVFDKLYITIDKVELPYLYFLPDISQKDDLFVQPVVVTQHSATARLAHFLDQLLRPVVERQLASTTFVNGADFIRKLNDYIEQPQHRLRPTTQFVTIKISNFYTMVAHGTMLIALQDFLTNYLIMPTINNISMGRIIRLTALFLHNNRFYYDHKIYRFAKGSPMSFPLTETLCNCYILQWQKLLVQQPLIRDQFYGRWNGTINEFHTMIKMIANQNSDIHLDVKMGSSVRFLHAHIENQNGTLYSRVYHESTIQPYTLPYVIGHAKVVHSHWFRSALIRAVRYCTSVHDFNQERIYLEMTCLANGYTLEFIEKQIDHFFKHFDAESLRSSLDQHVYNKLRRRLFNFISEQRNILETNREAEKKHERIRLSYLYEYGPKRQFHEQLHKILSTHLNTSTASSKQHNKLKLILTTKQPHSLNALLSQQKPKHELLNKNKLLF